MIKLTLINETYVDQDGKEVDFEIYKSWYSIPYESVIYLFEKEDDYNRYLSLVKTGTQKVFEETFNQLSDVK